MSRGTPPGAYRPGRTPLHRARAGAKLLGLLLFGIAVVAVPVLVRDAGGPGWVISLVALALGLTLAFMAGLRTPELLRVARGFALVGLLLFAFQTWQRGWELGLEVVGGILALILAASAVTASTSTDDMLDTVTASLRPLRPLGISPDRVALTFALAIRALPLAYQLAAETRDAARARGLERDPRALLVPFVLRMVAHSSRTGAALQARGLDD